MVEGLVLDGLRSELELGREPERGKDWMPDPAITVGLSAVAVYAGKDVITRLLGPTADFLGGELKDFAQRRKETVGRIFRNAAEKAQDRLDEPGAVPPRVLRDVLNHGSFQDDDLAVECFGGVLASSKTVMSRDDRSATHTGLLSRLSTYQIRSHFILYSVFRSVFPGRQRRMRGDINRGMLATFIPIAGYYAAMDFTEKELSQIGSILEHTLFGLNAEGLIEEFAYGDKLAPMSQSRKYLVFVPTILGAELFLRAHGIVPTSAGDILSTTLNLTVNCETNPARLQSC